MDELCPGWLIGSRNQVAKGAVNGDEEAMVVVEFEIANESGVGRPPEGLPDLVDQAVVALSRLPADGVLDLSLEVEGV